MPFIKIERRDPTSTYIEELKDIIADRHLDLEDIFKDADTSGSGKLDINEFQKLIRRIDPQIPFDNVVQIFQKIGGWDASISIQEFKSALASPKNSQESHYNKDEEEWDNGRQDRQQKHKRKKQDSQALYQKMEKLQEGHNQGRFDLMKIQEQHGKRVEDDLFFRILEKDYQCDLEHKEQKIFMKKLHAYGQVPMKKFYDYLHIKPRGQKKTTFPWNDKPRKTPWNPAQGKDAFDNQFDIHDEDIDGVDEFLAEFKKQEASNDNQPFKDPVFQTVGTSLWEKQGSRGSVVYRNYVWKGSKDYIQESFDIFNDEIQTAVSKSIGTDDVISPSDIAQGNLGDCYFLASISALAANPERIVKLFATRKNNKHGLYGVFLCPEGEMKLITVDQFIPCQNSRAGPAFTQCVGPEIWVQLLEKAYAKCYKSYERLEAGLCSEALRDITGAPTTNLSAKEGVGGYTTTPKIWSSLEEAVKEKWIITAGATTDAVINQQVQSKLGLVCSHAYSVLDCIEVKETSGREVQLVKLRNPWGKTEWQGEWGDKSSKWTPALRQELGVEASGEETDDGIFHMELDDFIKYYDCVTICRYEDDYVYTSVTLKGDGPTWLAEIEIPSAEQHYVTVLQKSRRCFPRDARYYFSETTLEVESATGQRSSNRENWIKVTRSGKLDTKVSVRWISNQFKEDLVLSVYGPSKAVIRLK